MQAQTLIDMSPLASLLLVGASVALGPALWVFWRNPGHNPHRRIQALRVFTLWLTFDLLVFGAFTRLTDSGLGCPDWPGCYGNTSPLGARSAIETAQTAMPDGPVTHAKAWIEMTHRYLATGVGALIVLSTIIAWQQWRQRNAHHPRHQQQSPAPRKPWLETLTLVWVCLQGLFGALTVTMKLFPAIVTLHLLGALVLLVLLCIQVFRGMPAPASAPAPTSETGAVAWRFPALKANWGVLLWIGYLLLWLQIALGGWVSTNYAVMACADFPTCQGRWWPDMNFAQGFELWRALGLTSAGDPIAFSALTAIHFVHRLMAGLLLSVLLLLVWQLRQSAAGRLLGGLLALQVATGLSNAVLGWPLLAALLHTTGAASLTLLLTWMLLIQHFATAQAAQPGSQFRFTLQTGLRA